MLHLLGQLARAWPDRRPIAARTVTTKSTTVGTIGKAGANIMSLYVQDQWQIGDRLTLNLGVRTENENVPTFRPEIQETRSSSGSPTRSRRASALRSTSRVTVVRSCMRATGATTTGRSTRSRAARSAAISGASSTARSTTRTIRSTRTTTTHPAVTSGGTAADCRDRRVPSSINNVDPDLKPMSQDSYSAGFDFEVNPRTVATIHYVHNNLIRTIEDLGGLVNGDEVYVIGNPGEGRTETSSGIGITADAGRSHAEAEAAVRRGRVRHQPSFLEQLVRQREPDHQPALRQLRWSGELGRNPHADDRRRRRRRLSSRRATPSVRAAT